MDADGATISTSSFSPQKWYAAKVPTTVLNALVQDSVYPDPYIGMNNMRIPDASDAFNEKYDLSKYSYLPDRRNPWSDPYWFRSEFKVPESFAGKKIWLTFKGINYRAAVWVNGKQVADTSRMVGMFEQFTLDVTNAVKAGSSNVLAVKIYPLDTPGLPAPPQTTGLGDFGPNGGPTGDIGKNVTMLCSVGWDWIPAVRDRNIGIWLPVYLTASGSVTINKPHVVTDLPDLPDTTHANIKVSFTLANHSGKKENGKLAMTIRPENFTGSSVTYTKNISLKAGESREVKITPKEASGLSMNDPHLWWPVNYGKPNLYHLTLIYSTGDSISDSQDLNFGIRTVSSHVKQVNGWARRDFYVNGRRINLVGGAWVPDMMLNRDTMRYENELKLWKNANLNLVRIWGGGIAPPDPFFESADRLGLLVWQDFWITGDTQGAFKGSPDWPLQGNVFKKNMISTILRLRNHPSLLLWTGGNEGHARKDLYDAMRNNVASLDGTRPFIPSSSGFAHLPKGWKASWPDDDSTGVYSGGPYSWQPPEQYYALTDRGKDWVWKDETGVPSQPPYSSLKKFITDLKPDPKLPYPINNQWGYHDAEGGNGKYDIYYNAIVQRYGKPTSIEDYSDEAQLANANSYRAIFESVNHKIDERGGVLLWKVNAAWPSVVWQLYDWYLRPNAGYYFTQRACEPLHVQLNLDDSTVSVINRNFKDKHTVRVVAQIYDIHLKKVSEMDKNVTSGPYSSTGVFSLEPVLKKQQGISFVELTATENGKIVSHNLYWLSRDHDFTAFRNLPKTNINVKGTWRKEQGQSIATITFDNPTDNLAFFVHPVLTNGKGGNEILPSFWSDNYFSLPPHQSFTVTVKWNGTSNIEPWLDIRGENVAGQTVQLSAGK